MNELLRSLHWEFGEHARITTTKFSYRQNTTSRTRRSFPKSGSCHVNIVSMNQQSTTNSSTYNWKVHGNTSQDLRTPCRLIYLRNYFHQVAMNIVKSMDRFSSYALACQTMSEDSKMIARVIINLMTNNAYLPITIISDKGWTKGSSWRSMDHCRTCHDEICTYNWHVWKEACVKVKSNENRNGWTMIVVVQVCQHCRTIYNTTYHTNIEWDLSRVFIRRIPQNVLDHRISNNSTETPILTSQGAEDIFLQTELIFPVVPKTPCKPISNTKPTLTKNASKLRE